MLDDLREYGVIGCPPLFPLTVGFTAVRLKAKQNQLFAGIDEFFLGVGWLKCL